MQDALSCVAHRLRHPLQDIPSEVCQYACVRLRALLCAFRKGLMHAAIEQALPHPTASGSALAVTTPDVTAARRAAGAVSLCQPNAAPTFNFSSSGCNQVGYYQACGAEPHHAMAPNGACLCLLLSAARPSDERLLVACSLVAVLLCVCCPLTSPPALLCLFSCTKVWSQGCTLLVRVRGQRLGLGLGYQHEQSLVEAQ